MRIKLNRQTLQYEMVVNKQRPFILNRNKYTLMVNQASTNGYMICKTQHPESKYTLTFIKNSYGRLMVIHGVNFKVKQNYIGSPKEILLMLECVELEPEFLQAVEQVTVDILMQIRH